MNAEIPIENKAANYQVIIDAVPQTIDDQQSLDDLYSALADCPLPEINDDTPPEQRDDIEV